MVERGAGQPADAAQRRPAAARERVVIDESVPGARAGTKAQAARRFESIAALSLATLLLAAAASADAAPGRAAGTTASVAPARAASAAAPSQAAALHAIPALAIPVHGIAGAQLRDTFGAARGEGRGHEAIDIAAPTGTPVYAVDDGIAVKLFDSRRGGLTVYQFDRERRLAYYYAHLDRYADGLREGTALRRCDPIGYVGTTGNAPPDAPHLHFAVFALGPTKQWWIGSPLNPYASLTAGEAQGLRCPK